jgi:hypothetical protein
LWSREFTEVVLFYYKLVLTRNYAYTTHLYFQAMVGIGTLKCSAAWKHYRYLKP